MPVVQVSGPTNDGNSLSVGAFELQSVAGKRSDQADGGCLTRLGAGTGCCHVRTRSVREKSWKSWSYRDRKLLVGLARKSGSRCKTRGVLADNIRRHFPGRSTAAILQELRRVGTRGVRVPLRALVLQPDPCENVDSGSTNETNREVWVGDVLSSILTDLRSAVGSCLGKAEFEKLVVGLLEGSMSLSQLPVRLACHAVESFPRMPVRKRREQIKQNRRNMVSSKLRRRLVYAALRKLYAKRRRDAAKVVIEGTWDELSSEGQELPVGTLEYWKSVLSREGQCDPRRPLSGECLAALVEPITIDETRWALRAMRNDTAPGLQEKLLVAQQLLVRAGMNITTQKSISPHLAASAKAKQLVLVPSDFQLNGVTLPVMGPTHRLRYLGLDFTWKGKVSDGSVQFITEALGRLLKAPLKPQQRREVLIVFLLPRLIRRLVLEPVKRDALRKMGKLFRAAYRSWARFPADSNNA
ncbi:hypothetical protein P879_12028, partial [Paragonimus westermani]